MFIFDVIELRQHIRSIGEYVFYMADAMAAKGQNLPSDAMSCLNFIRDHLKNMSVVLDKYDKDS